MIHGFGLLLFILLLLCEASWPALDLRLPIRLPPFDKTRRRVNGEADETISLHNRSLHSAYGSSLALRRVVVRNSSQRH